MERAIDRYDIANLDQGLDGRVPGYVQLLFNVLRQSVTIGVVELDVEGLQPLQDRQANPPSRHSPRVHPLQVIGTGDAIGYVPAPLQHPLVRWDIVADKREDHHDHVLRDADGIAVGHLRDRDAPVDCGLKIDMIGPDTSGHRQFQLFRLGNALRREIGRPEGLGNDNICVDEFALEHAVRPILVGRHNEGVTLSFQKFPETEFTRHATEESTRLEIDCARRGKSLSVRVSFDPWQVVSGISLRIAIDGIVV
jgi:hypothetical protein